MNKSFDDDRGGRLHWIAWLAEIMAEALRVIKPGGHALVWSLPRTSHWTGMALEDAGWQVRDCIYSIQGAGFPKSQNISIAIDKYLQAERQTVGYGLHAARRHSQPFGQGATQAECIDTRAITAPATPEAKKWDGWQSALKPAVECWWLCRKPLSEKSIAENVLTWGCGGINIDACRVRLEGIEHHRTAGSGAIGTANGIYSSSKDPINRIQQEREQQGLNPRYDPSGRFPSNLLLSHDPRCIARGTKRVRANGPACTTGSASTANDYGKYQKRSEVSHRDEHGLEEVPAFECHPSCPVRVLGEQSGESKSKAAPRGGTSPNPMSWGEKRKDGDKIAGHEDEGTAARYFQQFHDPLSSLEAPFHYFSKSSRRDRNSGLEGMPTSASSRYGKMNGTSEHTPKYDTPEQNDHPTVKSLALCRWLCRLVGVPGGIILDPFAGSGSTLCAAIQEGFHFIGIEQDAHYCDIARARIAHAQQEARREESAGQEWDCVEECPIKVLGKQSGECNADPKVYRRNVAAKGRIYSEQIGAQSAGYPKPTYADKGTAARYFTQLAPDPLCQPAKPPTRKPKRPTPSPCTAVSLWDTGEEEAV